MDEPGRVEFVAVPPKTLILRACPRITENLGQYLRNLGNFGVPVAVGINHFTPDTDAELDAIRIYAEQFGVETHVCRAR